MSYEVFTTIDWVITTFYLFSYTSVSSPKHSYRYEDTMRLMHQIDAGSNFESMGGCTALIVYQEKESFEVLDWGIMFEEMYRSGEL